MMNYGKASYLSHVLHGLKKDHRMIEAALVFYHCEISLGTAREYLEILQEKLK